MKRDRNRSRTFRLERLEAKALLTAIPAIRTLQVHAAAAATAGTRSASVAVHALGTLPTGLAPRAALGSQRVAGLGISPGTFATHASAGTQRVAARVGLLPRTFQISTTSTPISGVSLATGTTFVSPSGVTVSSSHTGTGSVALGHLAGLTTLATRPV